MSGADGRGVAQPDAAPARVDVCRVCGEALLAAASFCEACGAPAPASPAAAGSSDGDAPSPAAESDRCAKCGGEIDADGYCTSCGMRTLEPVTVATDEAADAAYATHRGRRHDRNEDAAALAVTSEGWPVVVVSDGVSASPNPHVASAAAVTAAADRLAGRPFTGAADLVEAVAAAHVAASATPAEGDPNWPHNGAHPACTIVVAVAAAGTVHMANVGDARGYLLTGDGSRWEVAQLTSDDSGAAQAIAAGADPDLALSMPGGHALTAWLGADAPELDPHLATHPTAPGDVLLVCSDGLWNYAPIDEALGTVVSIALPASEPFTATGAVGACRRLASWAIAQGGADNVTVALAPAAADGTNGGGPEGPPGGGPVAQRPGAEGAKSGSIATDAPDQDVPDQTEREDEP